jgi:hypothetical protein
MCARPTSRQYEILLDVRMFVHHHTIKINQPTRCNKFPSVLLDVYVTLNIFWAPPRPSSGAYNCINNLWFLPLERGGSSAVVRGLAGYYHDQQHCYHHAPTVKQEAVNAVVSS